VSTPPVVGIAAFRVDDRRPVAVEMQAGGPVRSASVVKPLLVWVAADIGGFARDRRAWATLARPAIATSDNDATGAVWRRAGADRLLATLHQRTGVTWRPEGTGEHPSLRLMVTATELAQAYAELAADPGDAARDVRRWLREVRSDQTFGLRAVAAEVVGAAEGDVGVKCGWFAGERVHAVVLVSLTDRVVGGAVTTSWSPDTAPGTAFSDAAGDDRALVALHEDLAGDTLRSAMAQALAAAALL
jgi:hypothetical protein